MTTLPSLCLCQPCFSRSRVLLALLNSAVLNLEDILVGLVAMGERNDRQVYGSCTDDDAILVC